MFGCLCRAFASFASPPRWRWRRRPRARWPRPPAPAAWTAGRLASSPEPNGRSPSISGILQRFLETTSHLDLNNLGLIYVKAACVSKAQVKDLPCFLTRSGHRMHKTGSPCVKAWDSLCLALGTASEHRIPDLRNPRPKKEAFLSVFLKDSMQCHIGLRAPTWPNARLS